MFHLWIGVMAGALLTHLWTSAGFWDDRIRGFYVASPVKPRWWRTSMRWSALATIGLLLLLVVTDFSRAGLGWLEAFKSILLPSFAGVGFGIWMYAAFAPAVRSAAEISWVPILIALLFVAAILSEERYGWFTRLQKITIAGGGVEFAALAPTGATPADRSPLGGVLGATGVSRIDYALLVIESLPRAIQRDRDYATETGRSHADQPYYADTQFATKVVAPLAKRLRAIHAVRGYNDIEFVTDRHFVDDFRALVQGHLRFREMRDATDPVGFVADRIKVIWQRVCAMDRQLRAARFFAPPSDPSKADESCEAQSEAAAAHLNSTKGSGQPAIALNPELPYGTVIASMLLYAAGEADSAVRDLDRWIAFHGRGDETTFREIGLYRARYQSTQLLTRDNPEADKIQLAIEKYQELIAQAERLLSSTFEAAARSRLPAEVRSWRGQRKRLDESDRTSRWSTVDCEQDLSRNFKIFMKAYLSAKNNLAYHLSQNLELARLEHRDRLMQRLADEVVKVNMFCLRLDGSSGEDDDARSSQASFLDTAAAVQLELALREERRAERRGHLCKAQEHLLEAAGLYAPVMQRARQGEPQPKLGLPAPWEEQTSWNTRKSRMEAVEMSVILQRRLQRVQGTLAHVGMSC